MFFSIPETLVKADPVLQAFHVNIVPGVFLFIILGSALFMSNALIGFKKIESEKWYDSEIAAQAVEEINTNENKKIETAVEKPPAKLAIKKVNQNQFLSGKNLKLKKLECPSLMIEKDLLYKLHQKKG